jgi:hypothetical protein
MQETDGKKLTKNMVFRNKATVAITPNTITQSLLMPQFLADHVAITRTEITLFPHGVQPSH